MTAFFADGMHVDVTPSARLPNAGERESHIFHANPDKPAHEERHVPMNAYGFGEWYNARTPIERRFADAVNRRIYEAAGIEIRADAQFDEVPGQVPLIVKSVTTVALQLLKRHLLAEAGLPRRAMRMTVVIDEKGEGHAVLTLLTDRGDLVLDNKTSAVLPWHQTGYTFIKRESQDAVAWVSLGRAASPVTTANR